METHTIHLNGIRVSVPFEWRDITEMIGADEPVYTITRNNGNGALQFSISHYGNGKVPDLSPDLLLDMSLGLGETEDMGRPFDVVKEDQPVILGAASFRSQDYFVRVWTVSDGRNFARAIFTCAWGYHEDEVKDAEEIVRSIQFS